MKKVLFVAHVESHILHFHIPYLQLFHDKGYEVHVATNGDSEIPYCDVKHNLPFQKSPIKKDNYIAFKKLKKILNEENFEIIHCHTPVGGVVARLANRSSNYYVTTRMIYTAHGFHFYDGAPISYWMIFYPIERWLAHYTDILITINQEDYQRAQKFHLKSNGRIEIVHGVGVDEKKFNFELNESEKMELRKELGLRTDDYVLIFPAELSKRKNQIFLINAMEDLVKINKSFKLLLPGKDLLNEELQKTVTEKELNEYIKFLGYRKDIHKLLKISDLAVSSSRQEGLPINLIEALFSNVKVLSSKCRGSVEIQNIDFFESKSEFVNKVLNYFDTNKIGKNQRKEINENVVQYSKDFVMKEYIKLYFNNE